MVLPPDLHDLYAMYQQEIHAAAYNDSNLGDLSVSSMIFDNRLPPISRGTNFEGTNDDSRIPSGCVILRGSNAIIRSDNCRRVEVKVDAVVRSYEQNACALEHDRSNVDSSHMHKQQRGLSTRRDLTGLSDVRAPERRSIFF